MDILKWAPPPKHNCAFFHGPIESAHSTKSGERRPSCRGARSLAINLISTTPGGGERRRTDAVHDGEPVQSEREGGNGC